MLFLQRDRQNDAGPQQEEVNMETVVKIENSEVKAAQEEKPVINESKKNEEEDGKPAVIITMVSPCLQDSFRVTNV